MSFPSLEQVEAASQFQLARWMRFLPSPGQEAAGRPDFETVFESQLEIQHRISQRFQGWTPDLSKAAGW